MRISEAAKRLGTSARMLRYREELGLLPQVRDRFTGPAAPWPRPGAARTTAAGPGAGATEARAAKTGAGGASEAGATQAWGAAGTGGAARTGAHGAAARAGGAAHRQFSEAELEAVAAALELERRYDISPASLAFGLRVLAEPSVRAAVADLGRRLGRIPATPVRALDFEKERALRLLRRD
jgi:MerR family transcriptional regulator, copper efflux regulator